MGSWRKWWRACDGLLFPSQGPCTFCGQHPGITLGVCRTCLDSLAVNWQTFVVMGYPCYALLPYQAYGRDLIHKMKFQGGYEIACKLGFFLGLALDETVELNKTQVLIPVPLHATRFTERGFNQAAVLADNMGEVCNYPVSQLVVRVRPTMQQSGLSVMDRKKNLRGAFSVLPGANWRGKQVLIVDDVITSGATFLAIASIVEQYGGEPRGVFVARTKIQEECNHAKKL